MKYYSQSRLVKALLAIVAISCIQVGRVSANPPVKKVADDSFIVEEITVTGLQRMDLGTFFNMLPLQVGEKIDLSRVPIIIRTLYAANSFEDIRLFRDGRKLFFDIKERPSISEIQIDGNSDIKTEQILEAMENAGFSEGEVFDPSAIKNIKMGMEEQYFSHGKYSIKIEDKIIEQSRNRVIVQFNIKEGAPAKIQRINLIGNKIFDSEELLKQFELTTGGMFSFFSSDDQYSREKLEGDLENMRSYYQDRGYLNYKNTSTQVSISPDRKGIYLTVNIDEGEKFIIEKIVFTGELVLKRESLEMLMPLKKGDTYSAAAISFAEEQIKTSLGYQGYAFANVVTIPNTIEEENKVELTLYIEPGKKVYVDRINFSGNESTNDEVLRREVRIMESGALSTNAVERSKIRLQRLPYLESVEVETPKVEDKDDRVEVNYKVKERSAGTIQGGVGYSANYGVSLNLNTSHNNFLGSGKKIGIGLKKDRFSNRYAANYWDPYFTIDAVSAGVGLEYSKSDYGEINFEQVVLDRIKLSANLGYPVNEITRLNFGLSYEDNKMKADRYTISQQLIDFYEENDQDIRIDPDFYYDLFRFTVGWNRSSLNRTVFPTRGVNQTLSLSATIPGSDLEFYKLEYSFKHYAPISSGWTFLSSFRAAYGDGYGDSYSLPYIENFGAGGSGTMRGFETNTIGPRVIQRNSQSSRGNILTDTVGGQTSIPLPSENDTISLSRRSNGGNARVLGTLELIFPVPFVEESNSVRTSAFVDIGNLWDTTFDREKYNDLSDTQFALVPDYSEPEDHRISAGFSLQWLSPMGPLTISLSKVIRKEELDEVESFSFNVGTTF